jgi:hypothetical protein
MIIDLSMTPQSTIRLIVTRDRSFFKLASYPRISDAACIGHAVASAAPAASF